MGNSEYHARGNLLMQIHFKFPAIFCLICIRIEFKFIHQERISCMGICICYKNIPASSARYVHLIQHRWCSEFFTCVYVH